MPEHNDRIVAQIASAVRERLHQLPLSGERNVIIDTVVEATKTTAEGALGNMMMLDPSSMLAHARSLFEYHAGQRLTSIRYFMVIYGILVTAFFTVISNDFPKELSNLFQVGVSALMIIVTVCFWFLDIRNSELVAVNEFALRDLEGYAAGEKSAVFQKYSTIRPGRVALHGLNTFQMSEAADKGILEIHRIIQYKFVVNALFGLLTILSGVLLGWVVYDHPPFVEAMPEVESAGAQDQKH